jgi:hypothetical protein
VPLIALGKVHEVSSRGLSRELAGTEAHADGQQLPAHRPRVTELS